jgi:hypothetical protein
MLESEHDPGITGTDESIEEAEARALDPDMIKEANP